MDKSIWLFPGQGSQKAGMGRAYLEAFPTVGAILDRAAQITDLPLRELCLKSADAELCKTENAQPTLFSLSYAIAQVLLEKQAPKPILCGGHSLGHFTALACCGALAFADAARLVALRGRLMAQAGQRCPGGMLAVLNLDADKISAVLSSLSSPTWIANRNLRNQTVISAARADLNTTIKALSAAGGRCIPLNVSGAFHSPLLDEEAAEFSQSITALEIHPPQIPILSNAEGAILHDVDAIREDLRAHMTRQVDWVAVMDAIQAVSANQVLEVGPGRVLKGMIMRHSPDTKVYSTDNPKAILRLFMDKKVRIDSTSCLQTSI